MSMDFRFRPGIQTSLNSSANIKSNIAAKKAGEGGTSGIQNTAGKTAAQNLANTSSLSTNNWDANSSVFNIKNTGATTGQENISKKSSNFVSHGYGGTSTGSTNSTSGFTRDNKYVSSGYWNKEAERSEIKKMQLTGENNWGVSRMPGATGGNRRSGLREMQRDAAMERYIYDQTTPQVHESFWQKAAGVATGVAGVAGLVSGGVELGKSIASLFSKSSKAEVGNDNGSGNNTAVAKNNSTAAQTNTSAKATKTGDTPAPTQTRSNASIQGMENAKSSQELGQAIDAAKDDVGKIDDNISDQKAVAAEKKAAKSGLKATAKQEAKQAKAANKEVQTHKESAAKYKQQASQAKGAMEGYQKKIDSNTNTIKTNDGTIDQNKQKLTDISSQLNNLKEPKKPGANASAAEQAQYQKDLAEYKKTKAELENNKEKPTKENKKLGEENTKLKEDNNKLEAKVKEYQSKYDEAKSAESKETSLAGEAQKTADKENAEAKKAEEAYDKNNAEYQAAKENISDLKQDRIDISSSIVDQEARKKQMMKEEAKGNQ